MQYEFSDCRCDIVCISHKGVQQKSNLNSFLILALGRYYQDSVKSLRILCLFRVG